MKLADCSHRRKNILTGEWVLVSPHRTKRPWQGKQETVPKSSEPEYLDDCYLCPGNLRAGGMQNPEYDSVFVFVNDFSALQNEIEPFEYNEKGLLEAKSERGICKVICFSPKHNLTLAEMEIKDIETVIKTWKKEYKKLGQKPSVNYVQIFENKGAIMGCSNPHPHGQIWAQESIPNKIIKECTAQKEYFLKNGRTLLSDYIKIEKQKNERIVFENESYVLLVPFWAVWPFEVMIISKREIQNILQFTDKENRDFAEIIKVAAIKYDNIFNVSFPYSAGMHQAPTDGNDYPEWHFHMHFYPPLLRSASIKKFMVGYEMLAEPQRDITPEKTALFLKQIDNIHYKLK